MSRRYDLLESPIGRLLILADEQALIEIHLGVDPSTPEPPLPREADPLGATTRLQRYFEGDLAALDDLPVAPEGTAFQQLVWAALREIPAGSTTTYGALATSIGKPKAVRAVGVANGANPLPLVLPCHRVIGADGSLTGYGGGLPAKRWLLEHEGIVVPAEQQTDLFG